MNEVEWITDLDIPIFGLTGTFPLNLDADLSRRFSVINRNNMTISRQAPIVVRSPTERPSISYQVRYLTPGQSTHEGQVQIIHQYLQSLSLGEKMIIFAGTKRNVDNFAESTGLPCYYSERLDKQKQINRFLTAQEPAIITTTALASGVNLPNVRVH